MLMTAAGTTGPAQVLVLGAGVAGLQAIATARRLGAVVTGYDVAPRPRERYRARSGAAFLDLAAVGRRRGEGGYARALTDEESAAQQAALDAPSPASTWSSRPRRSPAGRPPLLVPTDALDRRCGPARSSSTSPPASSAATSPGSVPDDDVVTATASPSSAPATCRRACRRPRPPPTPATSPRCSPHLSATARSPSTSATRSRPAWWSPTAARSSIRRSAAAARRQRKELRVTPLLLTDITVFVLSLLVGFEVISKVPATLHTPLMSGANADPRRGGGRCPAGGRRPPTRCSATCCVHRGRVRRR